MSAIYPTRRIGTYPQQYVQAVEPDRIEISFASGIDCMAVSISRQDARLLAKRLNQCLDDTRRKAARNGGPT